MGGWSHWACAFQEGPFGKAGPEAPAPDGGPPSHAHFALSGRIWGATSGLHSTWALLHRHPCPAQRCHCPEETLSLSGPGRFGAQYQEPFTGHPERTSRACASFVEVDKHLLCAGPHLRLRKFRRGQSTAGPLRVRSPGEGAVPGQPGCWGTFRRACRLPAETLARPSPSSPRSPCTKSPCPSPLLPIGVTAMAQWG